MPFNLNRVSDLLRESLAPPTEAERLEETYRRAYLDGWITAMDAFYDRIPTLGRDGAYNILWDFWLDDLRAWAGGDCRTRTLPPPLSPPRRN